MRKSNTEIIEIKTLSLLKKGNVYVIGMGNKNEKEIKKEGGRRKGGVNKCKRREEGSEKRGKRLFERRKWKKCLMNGNEGNGLKIEGGVEKIECRGDEGKKMVDGMR